MKWPEVGPVIFGLDLRELSFKQFGHHRMFDKRWHLRTERFIIFQCAMLIGLAAECTATYSLAKNENLQKNIERTWPGSHLYNNDLLDCEISVIVFCVFVATIFGADFFFLLQYPRQRYPDWIQNTKIACASFISLGMLASAIASSVIIARNSSILGGLSPEDYVKALEQWHHPKLTYRVWSVNRAWIVLLWIAVIFCFWSTYLMYIAAKWDKVNGTDPEGGDTESLRETMPKYHRAVPGREEVKTEVSTGSPVTEGNGAV